MSVITRRRVVLAGVTAAGGWWFLGRNGGETTVEESENGVSYSSDPVTFSGTGSFVSEEFEVERDGVVVGVVETGEGGRVRLYDTEQADDSILLQGDDRQNNECVAGVYAGDFQLVTERGVGEFDVSLRFFNEDVTEAVLTPPVSMSGRGVSVIGPVNFNSNVPVEMSLETGDVDSVIEVYDTTGQLRVSVFSEGGEYSNGVLRQERWVGGVGFLRVVSDGEWSVRVSPVETYTPGEPVDVG